MVSKCFRTTLNTTVCEKKTFQGISIYYSGEGGADLAEEEMSVTQRLVHRSVFQQCPFYLPPCLRDLFCCHLSLLPHLLHHLMKTLLTPSRSIHNPPEWIARYAKRQHPHFTRYPCLQLSCAWRNFQWWKEKKKQKKLFLDKEMPNHRDSPS